MKKKLTKQRREMTGDPMVDPLRLRAALMIACVELAGGDPILGQVLAEEFYDEAPQLLKILTADGLKNLPAGPAQVVPFPTKTT